MIKLRNLSCLLLILVLALGATACGSDDDDGGEATTPAKKAGASTTTSGGGSGEIEAELSITVNKVGGKGSSLPVPASLACDRSLPATCRGDITCPAPEGADPAAEAVCATLVTTGTEAITAKVADDEVCTEIYGGDETATITGTLDGQKVDAKFTRANGCEIARYDAVAVLWAGAPPTDPTTAGATPPTPAEAPPTEPEVISDPPEAFDK